MVKNYDMAMNIKSTTAHDLAKELAAIEHTSVTQAVTLSLREALDRRRSQEIADQRLAKISIDPTPTAAALLVTQADQFSPPNTSK